MANITKRGNSYRIKVSCGYDTRGKQVMQAKTWKPDPGMTERQIKKELQKQAVQFEEECLMGTIVSAVKFEDLAKQWFVEYAEMRLKPTTIRGYHFLEPRIYKAIGHMRLDKITPRHLQRFINELCQTTHKNNPDKLLSPKVVKNHLSLISNIFQYAVRMQMVSSNPCRNVYLPAQRKRERTIYTLDEIREIFELLDKESDDNFKYVVFFKLALYTGLRRGELFGLEWKDFDWQRSLLNVNRNSQWTKERGIYTDTPKTESSVRSLKMCDEVVALLKEYKQWQDKRKAEMGSKWEDHDRLFTTLDGKPLNISAASNYWNRFCSRNGIRYCPPHSFRHLNATIMIESGVDVKTVQTCLGHSDAATTMSCYLHTFQSAQAAAMDTVANIIQVSTSRKMIQENAASGE